MSTTTKASLFTLEGDYALDDDRRIGRRFAKLKHAEEALAFAKSKGWRDVQESLRQEMELLHLYWSGETTKEQAIAAWREAQQATA